MGSSSLTRDQTWAPCLESLETTGPQKNSQEHFFFKLFLIGESLLYSVVLVSVTQQRGSAASVHVSPSPRHSFGSSQSTRLSSLAVQGFPPAGCITLGSVYVSVLPCQRIAPVLTSLCPQVCSARLHLSSCPADRFAAAAQSHQSCPPRCDPTDGSPPGYRPCDSPGKQVYQYPFSRFHIYMH